VAKSAVPHPPKRARALDAFLSSLAEGEHDIAAGLAAVLGVATLRIAYWLPGSERWVDSAGAPQEIDGSRPEATIVSFRGQRVAAVVTDPPTRLDLDGELMPAVALALEANRLGLALKRGWRSSGRCGAWRRRLPGSMSRARCSSSSPSRSLGTSARTLP